MRAYFLKNTSGQFIHTDVIIFAKNEELATKAVKKINKRLRSAWSFCVHSPQGSIFPTTSPMYKWLEKTIQELNTDEAVIDGTFLYELRRDFPHVSLTTPQDL